jgi:hypothetical protein
VLLCDVQLLPVWCCDKFVVQSAIFQHLLLNTLCMKTWCIFQKYSLYKTKSNLNKLFNECNVVKEVIHCEMILSQRSHSILISVLYSKLYFNP